MKFGDREISTPDKVRRAVLPRRVDAWASSSFLDVASFSLAREPFDARQRASIFHSVDTPLSLSHLALYPPEEPRRIFYSSPPPPLPPAPRHFPANGASESPAISDTLCPKFIRLFPLVNVSSGLGPSRSFPRWASVPRKLSPRCAHAK